MWASSRPPIVSSSRHGNFCKFEQISQRCSSAMVGAMMMQQQQRGSCVAGVGVGGVLDVVASSRVRMQTVGKGFGWWVLVGCAWFAIYLCVWLYFEVGLEGGIRNVQSIGGCSRVPRGLLHGTFPLLHVLFVILCVVRSVFITFLNMHSRHSRGPFAFHESKAAFAVTRNYSSCRRTPAFPFKNVKSDKRSEPFDQLKLKLARREASILRSQETMNHDRLRVVSAVASQALQDKAAVLFARICVNPKVLSPEAAEFMLTVSASHTTLSQSESESASQADLILRGVHPTSFQPVLLVCTTTMFATPVAQSDVEKAKRRGELWQRAVGAAFLVVPVVAGYAVSTEIGDFSKDIGVVCCDISK